MVKWLHGKTTKSRSSASPAGARNGSSDPRHPRAAPSDGGSASSRTENLMGTNGPAARRGAGDRAAVASWFSGGPTVGAGGAQKLGRPAARLDGRRGGGSVSQALDRPSASRRGLGVVAHPGRTGATAGPSGERIGGLSPAGPAWLAQGGPGPPSPQERSSSAGGLEKQPPEDLAAVLKSEAVRGRPVRIVFQDEARFGRMVRLRRGWAPAPLRPTVANGYERQFVYVYGAVSPLPGELDWRICPQMNPERMNKFLAQVSQAHPGEFIFLV
jgi:hypothetical protein